MVALLAIVGVKVFWTYYMIHLLDHVSASTTLRRDYGIQTPDRAGNQRLPHVGTLAQDPEETDDGSDSEGLSDPVTEAAPDYLEGLGDGDLTGAHLIQIIMGQLGTLCEEDRTALTGVLARSTVHEATEVLGGEHAICHRLRWSLQGYMDEPGEMELPRYWLLWLAKVQRCLGAAGRRRPDPRTLIDMEENVLMQVGGHKLTAGERLARPHRPAAWTEALQRLTQLPPHIATRSRAILRKWLSEKAQQTGYTLAAVGMMLRDVLMDCTLQPLEAAAEKKAAEAAAEVQQALQHYRGIAPGHSDGRDGH